MERWLVLLVLCLSMTQFYMVHCRFTYCQAAHGNIQSVSVSDCSPSDAFCKLKKNTNVSLAIDFMPKYNAKVVTVNVVGEVASVPIPFPIDPSDACNNYGLVCPLSASQSSKFRLELPIKSIYPTIPVLIKIELVDDSKTDLACVKFNARIVN